MFKANDGKPEFRMIGKCHGPEPLQYVPALHRLQLLYVLDPASKSCFIERKLKKNSSQIAAGRIELKQIEGGPSTSIMEGRRDLNQST